MEVVVECLLASIQALGEKGWCLLCSPLHLQTIYRRRWSVDIRESKEEVEGGEEERNAQVAPCVYHQACLWSAI